MGFPQALRRWPPWAIAVACVTALRLVLAALAPVTPEEAYHWNWARHPDWCYYDHPPMIAWGIALGRLLFGDTALGIRFVPTLWSAGTSVVLARMAGKFYGERAAVWAVLLFSIEPIMFLAAGSGFPDSPLLFFWALAMAFIWKALESGRGPVWLAAGAALGAAGLSKYTGVFLGVSLLLYLLVSRRDRRWLATPWPYLASVLALVVLAPVFYWNSRHHWASFYFQGVERLRDSHGPDPRGALKYLGGQWGAILPLTLPLAIVAVSRCVRSHRDEERYVFWLFAPMPAFFFVVSWIRVVHLMWPLPAYLALTVAMAGTMVGAEGRIAQFYERRRAWLLGVSAAAGIAAVVHMIAFLPGISPMQGVYGWGRVAERARELRAGMPEGTFYLGLGRKYVCPSQLALQLRAPHEVHGRNLLGDLGLQYDFWADVRALRGRDAMVVAEDGERTPGDLQLLKECFASLEKVDEIVIPVGRATVIAVPPLQFSFYRARGYRPPEFLLRASGATGP